MLINVDDDLQKYSNLDTTSLQAPSRLYITMIKIKTMKVSILNVHSMSKFSRNKLAYFQH